MNVTNSFDQFSLVLSIRGRICDFLPCTRELDHALHSIERNQPQCRVCDGLTYNVKSNLFLVSLRGCNNVLKEKLNQWLLLLIMYKFAKSNSSKINFNHANVFCLLFALNHRLLCSHVHCILRAAGVRHARTATLLEFITIDLADPGFSPTIPCPFANYELANLYPFYMEQMIIYRRGRAQMSGSVIIKLLQWHTENQILFSHTFISNRKYLHSESRDVIVGIGSTEADK